MPIERMSIYERPDEAPPSQSRPNRLVVEDVIVVVVLNEVEVARRPVNGQGEEEQEEGNGEGDAWSVERGAWSLERGA